MIYIFDGRFDIAGSSAGLGTREILDLIESQSGVPADSFVSEAIGHPKCNAISMVFVVEGRLVPLFTYLRPGDIRTFLGSRPRQKILDGFEGKKAFFFRYLLDPKAWALLAKAAPIFGNSIYNVLGSRHIILFAKGFMNKDALDKERIDNCCYAITGKEGVVSFCAHNNMYRFAGNDQPLPIRKVCRT